MLASGRCTLFHSALTRFLVMCFKNIWLHMCTIWYTWLFVPDIFYRIVWHKYTLPAWYWVLSNFFSDIYTFIAILKSVTEFLVFYQSAVVWSFLLRLQKCIMYFTSQLKKIIPRAISSISRTFFFRTYALSKVINTHGVVSEFKSHSEVHSHHPFMCSVCSLRPML